MRVHLRNGEILVGNVESEELMLEAESGLELELDPARVNALFMHVDRSDGKPAPEVVALLKTHHGDQLAATLNPDSKVRAATAWGPIEVGLDEIDYLYPLREPQPIHRLLLSNKTRLSVIMTGDDLVLDTPRFNTIKVEPGAIARLASVTAAATEEKDDDEKQPTQPYCQLAGGNILVGNIDSARLEVETAGGVTPLDPRLLRQMERQEDEESFNPMFLFELSDETELAGRLRDGVLPIRAHGKVWKLPAYHVQSFSRPEKPTVATVEEAGTVETPTPATEERQPTKSGGSELDDLFGPPAPVDPFGGGGGAAPAPAGDPFGGGGDPFGGTPAPPAPAPSNDPFGP
jgi:hypothetical protein